MKKIIFFLLFLFSIIGNAQNAADVAQNFGSIPGFDSPIYCSATQSDGKILIGGNFYTYRGLESRFLTRLNPDGSVDTSFSFGGSGFNGVVFSIAIQNDGKILIGGYFTSFNGLFEGRIIRLNPDGSKDTSFNTGGGFNNTVYSIAIQTDGKILVGGLFISYNGITENRLVRLNSNGIKDVGFYIGTGFGNWSVNAIALQNDGKVIVYGPFGTFDNTNVNQIVRLNTDGSKDLTFNSGTGFNFDPYGIPYYGPYSDISIQNDGKIIIGGAFNSYNGVTQKGIIRLNTDGTKDSTFDIGTGLGGLIHSIAIQSDGKIIIGGEFSFYNGVSIGNIARLNTNGTLDTSLNTQGGFNNFIESIIIQNDGNIIVGGHFTSYYGVLQNRIIGLTPTGAKNYSFNTGYGFDTFVSATSQQTDGKILVAGAINNYKEIPEKKIIRLNIDGTKDTSFNSGTGFNNNVRCIAIQNDGKIIIGGEFTSFNGVTENYIIRLNTNGTKDSSFNTGVGFNNFVNTITLQSDGKILVGGDFNLYKGVLTNKMIRLNTDGTKDTTFNSGGAGFDNSINSIVLQNDGKILVGGAFTSFNGLQENRAIRLNNDGSKDTTFNIGTGFDYYVQGFALQSDGKIFVCGNFFYFNSVLDKKLVRLNSDGTRDSSFNTGTGFAFIAAADCVKSVIVQNDGKIIVGGTFNSYKGLVENNIIRLLSDGNKDTSFDAGIGFNNSVNCITPLNNGAILIGGNFTSYKSLIDSSFLVALNGSVVLSNDNFTKLNPITIWPNPVKEIINVDVLNNTLISSVKIYDLQGKLQIHTSKNSIDVSHFASGLYIIKVTTEEGEFTKKFIKE